VRFARGDLLLCIATRNYVARDCIGKLVCVIACIMRLQRALSGAVNADTDRQGGNERWCSLREEDTVFADRLPRSYSVSWFPACDAERCVALQPGGWQEWKTHLEYSSTADSNPLVTPSMSPPCVQVSQTCTKHVVHSCLPVAHFLCLALKSPSSLPCYRAKALPATQSAIAVPRGPGRVAQPPALRLA
jgi:hypothetical protein